jgi:hypothetical protein
LAFGAELEKISFRGIAPGESDSAIAKDATVRVTLIESRAYSDQVNPTVTKYNISGYPKEGVLILSSAYGTNEVGTVIYLIQADVLCEYYSFLREWGMNGSFTTQIPLDAPLLLQGSTAEYGWGGYYTPSTALPELCEGLYESKNGNRYVVLFRSDGKATDILAVTQSLRTGGGYWLLDARKADTDPIAQRRIKPEDTRAETQITVNAP